MRICHIIESANGGSSHVVLDLARYGINIGDTVSVIYAPGRASPEFLGAIATIKNLKIIPCPMYREVGLNDLGSALALYRTIKREGPFDIIHAHSSKAGALARILSPFISGNIVYTPHGFITLSPETPRYFGWIEKILSYLCSKIIVVSEAEKRHALSIGIPQKKLLVIPNGIAQRTLPSRLAARDDLNLPYGATVIGYVGRFMEPKNPQRAVAAFAMIHKDFPDAHLSLIGDGAFMPELQDSINSHHLTARVHLHGARNGSDAMAAFDALVCSSDYEGFPLVFMEALAAGIPIISTPIGGTEEAVHEGETGYLSQDISTSGLAEAMRRFLQTTPQKRQENRAHIISFSKRFNLAESCEKTRSLYKSLMHDMTFPPKDGGRPLRICHVVEATAGGSARIVAQLIDSSVTAGHAVTLIYSPHRADKPFHTAIAATKGLKKITLPMERRVSWQDIGAICTLHRLLKQSGPFDIIHTHSSKAGALTRLLKPFIRQAVIVHTPHGFFAQAPGASRIYSWIEWILSWLTDAIITVSAREQDLAIRTIGIPARKLYMILNGIALDYPVDRTHARALLEAADRDFIVGFVGRLVDIKNPLRLVEVFFHVCRKSGNAKLAIIGDGPLRIEMERRFRAYGIMERVKFYDHVDARDYIPGFDCLLGTSDAESFGLSFIEALYAGVPVVTTPVGVTDMILQDGVTGFIGSFDPAGLAEKVHLITALGPHGREAMRIMCRQQALRFDINKTVAETLGLYRACLQRKGRL